MPRVIPQPRQDSGPRQHRPGHGTQVRERRAHYAREQYACRHAGVRRGGRDIHPAHRQPSAYAPYDTRHEPGNPRAALRCLTRPPFHQHNSEASGKREEHQLVSHDEAPPKEGGLTDRARRRGCDPLRAGTIKPAASTGRPTVGCIKAPPTWASFSTHLGKISHHRRALSQGGASQLCSITRVRLRSVILAPGQRFTAVRYVSSAT
jgi:hypothetical protein